MALSIVAALLGWGARRLAKRLSGDDGPFLPPLGLAPRASASYLLTILSWGLYASALFLLSLLLP